MASAAEEPVAKRSRQAKLGFGIVGCGMGAETHAWCFAKMEEARFVGVFGRDPDKAAAFATRWGAERSYSSYEAFCADRDIDIVVICVPNSLHRDFAVPAAKAGKHLVVEKPLDTSLERGLEIARACRDSGVVLTGIYQMRFCEATRRIEEAIRDGRLGTLIHCDVQDKEFRDGSAYYGDKGDHSWAGKKDLAGGGCLTTQSSHVLDLMHTFMGDAKSVFAKARTALHDIDVEDICSAIVTFNSGATATVNSMTCIQPAFKHRVEVHGSKGTVVMNGEYDKIIFWDVKGEPKVDDFGAFGMTDISDPHGFPMDRHIANLRDAIGAVRSGGQKKPLLDADAFLKSELLRLSMYESAKSGKEVEIDYSKIVL